MISAAALGVLAIQQATLISAYHHARTCPPDAPSRADCLHAVAGSVAGVTDYQGSGRVASSFALDVRTAATTLHLVFSSDSPMLADALDGDRAVVTMWRGAPVSVAIGGRSEVPTSAPDTALASRLGGSEEFGGAGVLFVLGAVAIRRNWRAGGTWPQRRLMLPSALLALGLGAVIVTISGIALDGKPSRLGPDLAATAGALIPILGLSAWLGISATRRRSEPPVNLAFEPGLASGVPSVDTPVLPAAPHMRMARSPPRTLMRPARWSRVLGGHAVSYVLAALTAVVLFGVLLTGLDGPPARAYRSAPACVGETNLATCVGDFTAVVNGVRASAQGADFTAISYVTHDGAINTWARFDGAVATTAWIAGADKIAQTPVKVRVWHRSIVGAELGGTWRWADGDPPGNTFPTIVLAVSFALLLLAVRLRIHRRKGSVADMQRVLFDDLGQVAAAALSVVLLWYGFWAGAILALAVLLWLGLSVRRSMVFRRLTLAALHSS